MDPTSAVRTDTLPAIATLVAPGVIAIAPYAWLWLSVTPEAVVFFKEQDALAIAAAILLAVAAGFSVESLGSYVEVYCIDRRRPNKVEMLRHWWRYLRIAWVNEPIGQKYLQRTLTSFKFELNMLVATSVCFLGVGVLAVLGRVRWPLAAGIALPIGLLIPLFARAARDSSDLLMEIRATLLKGVGEPPFDDNDDPTRKAKAEPAKEGSST